MSTPRCRSRWRNSAEPSSEIDEHSMSSRGASPGFDRRPPGPATTCFTSSQVDTMQNTISHPARSGSGGAIFAPTRPTARPSLGCDSTPSDRHRPGLIAPPWRNPSCRCRSSPGALTVRLHSSLSPFAAVVSWRDHRAHRPFNRGSRSAVPGPDRVKLPSARSGSKRPLPRSVPRKCRRSPGNRSRPRKPSQP